ncbi:MAG TPA: lipoyl synthase [Acidimicrobiales bacterium]|nr:lipoyl synthase [Acidimicrobiales bacterium]
MTQRPLRVRWLGRVRYRDAHALQRALFKCDEDYLLLLEHPHVYTRGVRTKPEHLLDDVEMLGADLVDTDRGGDITYHGPGQLVGYPIISLSMRPRIVPDYVHAIEQLVIDTLAELGLSDVGRLGGYPGVWVAPSSNEPRKICAIGVRVSRGRTMHGFALNVSPLMSMFEHIVPCGLEGSGLTSLVQEGIDAPMLSVIDIIIDRARFHLGGNPDFMRPVERQDATPAESADSVVKAENGISRFDLHDHPVVPCGDHVIDRVELRTRDNPPSHRRLASAGVDTKTAVKISSRKPDWLRVEAEMGNDYLALRKTMRSLNLVTVCEEAGCPNIYECWADGTATFMINGERCTRSCGFCLVDTRHPLALDPREPSRVAEAVKAMGLNFAVITTVARDDLTDGGAGAFAATINAVRRVNPATGIEVLISDCKGDDRSLATIFSARPDVLNHNLETVLRLQRAARPSASYARSLSVLARAKEAGLTTKSGIILGMGEERDEVIAALNDLAAVGVDIVTIGQYLRPSVRHLPVIRYLDPEEFDDLAERARAMGFSHVEASPLTRSSYHARQAASSMNPVVVRA